MTVYLLFAGAGALTITGVSVAAGSDLSRAHVASGLQFTFITGLALCLALAIYLYVDRVLRRQLNRGSLPVHRQRRVMTGVALIACGTAIIAVAAQEDVTPDIEVISNASSTPGAATLRNDAPAVQAGASLFRERGCVLCHRPDGAGIAPSLYGLFGRPVDDPACGATTVDESYVRESILNPSSTIALGYGLIMPTFAGRLAEDELQSLVAYVKSLSVSDEAGGRRP